jgi:hypothetical protein
MFLLFSTFATPFGVFPLIQRNTDELKISVFFCISGEKIARFEIGEDIALG